MLSFTRKTESNCFRRGLCAAFLRLNAPRPLPQAIVLFLQYFRTNDVQWMRFTRPSSNVQPSLSTPLLTPSLGT